MNDTAALATQLRILHLPSMLREYESFAQKARKNNWEHERYLKSLCEIEVEDRNTRRIERNLRKSNLPDGKTMATFDLKRLPQQAQQQVAVLLDGLFVQRAENVLCFGLPGRGKTLWLSDKFPPFFSVKIPPLNKCNKQVFLDITF